MNSQLFRLFQNSPKIKQRTGGPEFNVKKEEMDLSGFSKTMTEEEAAKILGLK